MCRFDAVKHDWDKETKILEYNVAEHAKGVLVGKEGRAAFINFAISITGDCDCMNNPDFEVVDDIGILASTAPIFYLSAAGGLIIFYLTDAAS